MVVLTIITGATVTFKLLVEFILDTEFLVELAQTTSINKVVLQYGNEHEGSNRVSESFYKQHMHRLLKKLDSWQLKSTTGNVERYELREQDFILETFPFSSDISKFICDSDLIISHAGTGSIIDTLTLHKPLIVVVNSSLMDNHQEEIANELSRVNCCLKYIDTKLSVNKLIDDIVRILDGSLKLKPFPNNTDRVFQSIIYSSLF